MPGPGGPGGGRGPGGPGGGRGPGGPGMMGGGHRPPPPRRYGWGYRGYRRGCGCCLPYMLGACGIVAALVAAIAMIF